MNRQSIVNQQVKFVDEQLENYMSENGALRLKLQSKVEALKIIAKELDRCRTERDQFKFMAEQLQDRYSNLKKKNGSSPNPSDYKHISNNGLAQLLNETKEQNKFLLFEIESLRQKIQESEGDNRVLRVQLQTNQHKSLSQVVENEHSFPVQQKEELVSQLERLNLKISQMRGDIQSLLDEKEELIKERDAFKHKAHRVGHELAVALRSANGPTEDGKPKQSLLLDADALVSENRYLHERLQQADAETQLASQALTKYKSMLESKRRKGIVKLGTNNTDMIMSHKQVKQLLERGTLAELPVTAATISDLKSLCLGLLEGLNDKTLALAHQRKANRILATRITELETRVENLSGTKMSVFPSHILLEDYCSADADRQDISDELKLLEEEKCQNDDQIVKNLEESAENRDLEQEDDTSSDQQSEKDSDTTSLPPKLQSLLEQALEDIRNETINSQQNQCAY